MSRAVASLLAASVFAIAVLGVLIIWHLVRRGRLIREGLNRPRPVRWPALEPSEPRSAIAQHAKPTPTPTEDNDAES